MSSEALNCELGLRAAINNATGTGSPPKLAEALEYAVFPGGARVRPKLAQAVALAHGNPEPGISMAASVAVELLHCASLVHDDLPCFDDATLRRGKPSVHSVFGERIAVLTGDALIVAAFDRLITGALECRQPQWAAQTAQWVARGVGSPHGICAGQAWECEPRVDLDQYHKAKPAPYLSRQLVPAQPLPVPIPRNGNPWGPLLVRPTKWPTTFKTPLPTLKLLARTPVLMPLWSAPVQ